MAKTQTGIEIYRAGDRVVYSGEYAVVDSQCNKQNFDLVTLDEGETFPQLNEQTLCYVLNDTCIDESCAVIGGETSEAE